MNYKRIEKFKKSKPLIDAQMQEFDSNRLVEMAWQDRTSFDAIYKQYGLSENMLKKEMRHALSPKGYRRWRKRVQGRKTKHQQHCLHRPERFEGPW